MTQLVVILCFKKMGKTESKIFRKAIHISTKSFDYCVMLDTHTKHKGKTTFPDIFGKLKLNKLPKLDCVLEFITNL